MPIPWQAGAEAFAQILRRRGAEPDAVRLVDVAWDAFVEFLQCGIEGIDGHEDDGDGFITEWGRWDWNDHLPALAFGRLLAVSAAEDCEDPHRQPEYWKVELELVFDVDPAWADLDSIGFQDTGIDFDPPGEPRRARLAEVRRFIDSCPQLAAMWHAEPTRSNLILERAC